MPIFIGELDFDVGELSLPLEFGYKMPMFEGFEDDF